MTLSLTACHIPKLRQAQQTAVLPPTFNGTAEETSSAQLRVEEFYNDPILTRLACFALGNNRELKILEEDVQIARNEVLGRSGAYLPMLTAGGQAGTTQYSKYTLPGASREDDPYNAGRLLPNPVPDFLASINLSWQIDIWRQLRNARDAARARLVAAIEKRNYFVTRLVADVAEAYYGLMALDKRIENLNTIIALQEQSYEFAQLRFKAGRGTELAVQRFLAEVRKNQSEKLIVSQQIIMIENRINFLLNRYPQKVERISTNFLELEIRGLSFGVPAQLLQNRLDIRQAERELQAAGLDVNVARARFFPTLNLTGQVGYEAFNPSYFFYPQAFVANALGQLVVPLVNKRAIRAEYMNANARQLQTVYNYQRVVLNAFTEVVTLLFKVENYRRSIEFRKRQVDALNAAVKAAYDLYQAGRVEYMDVLFAQRDLLDARKNWIDTKREQLSAIVAAYQALGGGYQLTCPPGEMPQSPPEAQQLMAMPQLPAALPGPRKIEFPPLKEPAPAVPPPMLPKPKLPEIPPISAIPREGVEWVRARQLAQIDGK